VLGSGSFTITSSDGTLTTLTTDSSTLSDLATQINADALGVSATVITDANGSRLAITSNASGTAANFSVSAPAGASVQFNQAATGSNASLLVDGIQVDSASNSVAGTLPGVTLNLLNAAPGTNVSLNVTPDASQASAAINQFVSDFNVIVKNLNGQFTFNGSSEGVLAGDSAVRALQSDLLGALSYKYTPASGTTAIHSLSSLGISMQNDGTLAVDNATLTDAVQNHFSDVQTFFQGTAFNGFAQSLENQLTTFLSPSHGAFTVDLQSIRTQYSGLQDNINNFESNYIVPLQARLQSEYSQAEILLQRLPNQINQINTMLGQNTNGH
jgi:flagellar hook-associated protein 2